MNDRIRLFRELHASGCFVIPNPWDIGSARLLAQLGFRSLATTSSGFAWSQGRQDHEMTIDESLAHLSAIATAVEIPVSADFQSGFAQMPDGVAANVTRAAATGVAGVSIEDSTGDAANPLFDFTLAVERIQASRRALDATGTGVLLTARSEGFIVGRPDLAETIPPADRVRTGRRGLSLRARTARESRHRRGRPRGGPEARQRARRE